MNLTDKKKTLKIIKTAASLLWWLVLLLLAALLVNIFAAKLSGRVPQVFGYSVMNIVSGSMEDEIPRGSYVLIKRVDAEEIKKGDVICFFSSDPNIYGIPNTHRVVEEPIVTDAGIEFVTRGDANPIPDGVTAKGDRLIGVYVKRLDGLTSFVKLLDGNTPIIIMGVLFVSIAAMFVYATLVGAKGEPTPENKKEDTENKE